MITPQEAQTRLLAMARSKQPADIGIGDASGLFLAMDVVARRDQPWADLSAMDGYAIGPWESKGGYTLLTSIAAGERADIVVPAGYAARIFTGAPLPPGTDRIIIQENVQRTGDRIVLIDNCFPAAGRDVRPQGSDFALGDVVIAAGTKITAAQIGLAIAAGHAVLPCYGAPCVGLIASGNELCAPQSSEREKTPASNNAMLAALIRADGPAHVADYGIVADDPGLIAQMLTTAAAHQDVIVTTGGASVGDHDHVRSAIALAGGQVTQWKIAMRPGKPVIIGSIGQAIILGLPGNPVSAYVTATVLLLPLLHQLRGDADCLPKSQEAVLGAPVPPNADRAHYMRAWCDSDGRIHVLPDQDSASLSTLSAADCLLLRAPHAHAARPGDPCMILPLRR